MGIDNPLSNLMSGKANPGMQFNETTKTWEPMTMQEAWKNPTKYDPNPSGGGWSPKPLGVNLGTFAPSGGPDIVTPFIKSLLGLE